MKRWGERPDKKFISTTDVAAIPFIEILATQLGQANRVAFQEKVAELLANYSNSGETPGTMFYFDRLAQLVEDDKRRENFRVDYLQLKDEFGVKGEPSPYYALLQADGDNMGRTIDALEKQEDHSTLSQALSQFALQAKDIIKNHQGVPVYVGGDDVLAYLPLHTALACIAALNAKFKELVGDHFSFTENGETKQPSLSAGLAIAHHLNPLSDTLEQARRVEKAAKQIDGKNALVISMSKRSGSERTAKGKLKALVARMTELVTLTQANAISHGAAYELEDLHKRMQNSKLPAGAFEKEALRILKRKRESGSGKPVDAGEMATLVEQFRNQKGDLELDELATALTLALEFAKVQPKKEQQP